MFVAWRWSRRRSHPRCNQPCAKTKPKPWKGAERKAGEMPKQEAAASVLYSRKSWRKQRPTAKRKRQQYRRRLLRLAKPQSKRKKQQAKAAQETHAKGLVQSRLRGKYTRRGFTMPMGRHGSTWSIKDKSTGARTAVSFSMGAQHAGKAPLGASQQPKSDKSNKLLWLQRGQRRKPGMRMRLGMRLGMKIGMKIGLGGIGTIIQSNGSKTSKKQRWLASKRSHARLGQSLQNPRVPGRQHLKQASQKQPLQKSAVPASDAERS